MALAPDNLLLALFSGKGGVGKTTLACGFARYWARQFPTESVLLISTDPAHSLGDVLDLPVTDDPCPVPDLPNLGVRALDAYQLLEQFKDRHGQALELLVERGSFVEGDDLTPVWDLDWPGLDELMALLEIQRLLGTGQVRRLVVDMAPSGHTLNLFGLMDFLDSLLGALDLFQRKHHLLEQTFTGRSTRDFGDEFLATMGAELAGGRALLQDQTRTACFVVGIPEPMSYLESERFVKGLAGLGIPWGGLLLNRLLTPGLPLGDPDRYLEQQQQIPRFLELASDRPALGVPLEAEAPVGGAALDYLWEQACPLEKFQGPAPAVTANWPNPIPPPMGDLILAGRRLVLVGGKGGVGKTTIAAAISWAMASKYPQAQVRVISIDPAHSLGDAFGQSLGHLPQSLVANLSAQEVDAKILLQEFRENYLWELAEMMSGEIDSTSPLKLAYGPEAWRQIVDQALPGIDEMLALVKVMELLGSRELDLVVLDTAPTGHLLRFLEMPTALGDWLGWIFKLWIKYQDVLGRVPLMTRLRQLRHQVLAAQRELQNPQHTEFIGVVQAQAPILAEAERLSLALRELRVAQNYLVHNRYQGGEHIDPEPFGSQTLIRLPVLPRSVSPLERVQGAARLLFAAP